ncbi:MAG: hypothetical protein NWQ21_00285, partial [Desulfobacterales bacterium]|nr:hypothetical protein [Desulfobacterales bacterium]
TKAAATTENIIFVKGLWLFGSPRSMKIISSALSASRHFADGSRLLLRLKQAQLFEAFSGPCPIAIAHIR